MKKLTLITNAEIEYRSHVNGMRCLYPNSWYSAIATDDEVKRYKVWFPIIDFDAEPENACDWDDMSDYEFIGK